MMRARRSGYALIYLVAALPLIAVVGNVAVQVTARALAAQRRAVVEQADDAARSLLLLRLVTDARLADAVEGNAEAFDEVMTLRSGARVVEYRSAGAQVERVERAGDAEPLRSAWVMTYGTCAFRVERLANGRAVVWLRCDVAVPVLQRLPVARQYTTAMAVGSGGWP